MKTFKYTVPHVRILTVKETPVLGRRLDSTQEVYRYCIEDIATQQWFDPDKENLWVILLNVRLNAKGHSLISTGVLNECLAHPREILRPVIVTASYGFILAHNHPGGDPSPSAADTAITRRIREAADLFQISLIDHLIITTGPTSPSYQPFFSFREAGLL